MRTPVSTASPSVWTRRDFPDESSWSFNLSAADQVALVAYAHGGDSEDLADHFKAAAQRWGAILTHGPGFVRLRRFPTDVLNHEQIERAYLETLLNLPQRHAPSPETQLQVIEALVQIDRLLASLPPQTRKVFLLAQLDGLTLQQISEQVAMPVITVRRHIHKALLMCLEAA